MDFRIFLEPQQGTSYEAVCALALEAERLGFNGVFTSDHYLRMGDADGRPGPLDAWTTLAGLARDTQRLRLGTLVTPVTFRHPGSFAIQAAQVDNMSNGRIEIGFGAGWFEAEHEAVGIPFPTLGDRFSRLEEAADILTGLWATPVGELYSYEGSHFRIVESPGLPKPAQQPTPPFIVGGRGMRRTPRLAAKIASEFNVAFEPVDTWTRVVDNVKTVCADNGRDPGELVYSVAKVVCLGEDEATLAHRAKAIGRESGELRENGVAGPVAEAAAAIEQYAAAGCDRMYLQYLDIGDLDQLEEVAALVAPFTT